MRKRVMRSREEEAAGYWRRKVGAGFLLLALAGFSPSLLAQQQRSDQVSPEEYLERLEWRGILSLPGEMQFSFHDQEGESSFWISPDEVRFGVEVVDYDVDQNQVTLRSGDATRTLSLSASSVQPLEEIPSTEPPPLVTLNNSASTNEGSSRPEPTPSDKPSAEQARAAELWRQATAESGNLQEIDQQLQRTVSEAREVDEALSALSPDDPEYEQLATRRNRLREQRRVLTEGALTDLSESSNVPPDVREELSESLRSGVVSQIPSPPADSSADTEEQQPAGGEGQEPPRDAAPPDSPQPEPSADQN